MDGPEHARSSSSPSVEIARVTRRTSRRPGEEIEVVLSDASSFFIAMRVWEEAPFHEGDSLSAERWQLIRERTDLIRARGQAVSLLARAEHSRFLLERKLLQRGHAPGTIREALDGLVDDGLVSDTRFAESWVRSRLRSHPEGHAHLVAGLRERGVSEPAARAAVERVLADEETSMVEYARSYVDRLRRKRALSPEVIADRLYRRGFAGGVVRAVVAELETDDRTAFD